MVIKKVGILTGGGDCPGINSVLYGIMLKAFDEGIEVIGILRGWKGFIENQTIPLNIAEHDDLLTKGGTLLYTSRENPFKGVSSKEERAKEISLMFDKLGIDALIAIGGDDTLGVANLLYKYSNANIIGVPKTIDNDLLGSHYTFGFWSAVQLASNAIDNLTTTARSHQRIFIVEITGRDAGFLTMYSGISAGADIILIPETPFSLEKDVIEVLKNRVGAGYKYHIIACSEGAYPKYESIEQDFKTISKKKIENLPRDSFGNPLLSNLKISEILVKELNLRDDLKKVFRDHDIDFECRNVVLGHTIRAGSPSSFDRILGLRFGLAAMKLVLEGEFGNMVSLQGNKIKKVPLAEGVIKKYITEDNDKMELRDLLVKIRYTSKQK